MDEAMSMKAVQESVDQTALIEAQRKQIEKLEKQLKYSQDKVLALNTLIDIAEEQGIRIRKKSGAIPSRRITRAAGMRRPASSASAVS